MRVARISCYLLAAVLAACGTVRDRGACVVNGDCPAGQYCVTTADKGACVADAVPPTVSGLSVTCVEPAGAGTTCLRDGVLRVQATVTDDREVAGAAAMFDLGGPPVPLVRGPGNVWTADVRLAKLPFGYFEHAVLTTVTAHDTAGNGVTVGAAAGGVAVTRRRFARTLDSGVVSPGHPAVMQDGTVAVAGMNGKVYFVPWDGEGVQSTVTVGAGQISAAPLAIGSAVWIGSEDYSVYRVDRSSSSWNAVPKVNTGGVVTGSLALVASGEVIAGSDAGAIFVISDTAAKNSAPGGAVTLGPVVDSDGHIFAIAGGAVRRLHLQVGIPADDWSAPAVLSGTISNPVSCTTSLIALASTGADGVLRRVSPSGDPEALATTSMPAGGAALLADGSILVPEQTKTMSRWTNTGSGFPGWQKTELGAAPRTPLVLTATTPIVVPTARGAIHALRPDGSIAWSAQLSAGTASLQPGNIYTPPGQPAGEELSTAYFAGADGVLHAVIVDGKLDTAAPWPKVFHDPQNTNRAGAQP